MKKLLLIPILCTHILHAQTYIGPEIGMNTSNIKMMYLDYSFNNQPSTNFRGGAVLSVNGDRKVIYHVGLSYYGKGSNLFATSPSRNGQQFASHLVIHSVQLPVYASIQSRPGRYGRFFVGGGAFLDFQFAAREHAGGDVTGKSIEIGDKPGEIFGLDGGLGLQGGYRVNDGISLRLQYQFGLVNVSSSPGQTIWTRSFGVTIAYMGKSGVPKAAPPSQ